MYVYGSKSKAKSNKVVREVIFKNEAIILIGKKTPFNIKTLVKANVCLRAPPEIKFHLSQWTKTLYTYALICIF